MGPAAGVIGAHIGVRGAAQRHTSMGDHRKSVDRGRGEVATPEYQVVRDHDGFWPPTGAGYMPVCQRPTWRRSGQGRFHCLDRCRWLVGRSGLCCACPAHSVDLGGTKNRRSPTLTLSRLHQSCLSRWGALLERRQGRQVFRRPLRPCRLSPAQRPRRIRPLPRT
jgi:hypothetical protein